MSYLTIDFGGTRIRAAWFSSNMQMLHREETPTLAHEPQQTVINRIIALAQEVVPGNAKPETIGIVAPGPLDPSAGVILHAETLPGWKNVPLAAQVSSAFDDVPTYMQNDGNLAALAETYFGVAKNADPVLYLTISTGIGGGAVINGALFTGWRGMATEPGHMRFTLPDGRVCRLEELASGTALGEIATQRLTDKRRKSSLRELDIIDGQAVGQAALAGDKLALQVVTEAGQWLGFGIVNLMHLFNPQAVVLGGSVTKLGDLLLDPVRETVEANLLSPFFNDPYLIRIAALGDDVCLYGAAHYARTHAIWHRGKD